MKLCLGTLWGYSSVLKVAPAKQRINYFYYKSIHALHNDQICDHLNHGLILLVVGL